MDFANKDYSPPASSCPDLALCYHMNYFATFGDLDGIWAGCFTVAGNLNSLEEDVFGTGHPATDSFVQAP